MGLALPADWCDDSDRKDLTMARWQLAGDWPVGQHLVPVGTVLTGVARDGELVEAPTWNKLK
jgi:hypothetical protein